MTDAGSDNHGRTDAPLEAGEVETLLGFLDYQRATLAWKCRGLSDEQLRFGIASTTMTLGGMLKHLARVEDNWFTEVVAEQPRPEPWATMPWAAEWQNAADDTGDDLGQRWAARVEHSRSIVAEHLERGVSGASPLDATHPAWGGQARVSLRWVLMHMIEEYARHNGHADLLREPIDGQTGE